MQKRFAQLVAQSTDDAGKVDRAALFRALEVTPEDPVVLILEACFTAEDTLREVRGAFARQVAAVEQAHDRGAAAVARLLEAHATHLDATKQAIHSDISNVAAGAQTANDLIRAGAERLAGTAVSLATMADEVKAEARKLRVAVMAAWVAVALGLGAVVGVAVLLLRHPAVPP